MCLAHVPRGCLTCRRVCVCSTYGSRKTSVPLRGMVQDLLRAKSTQAGGRRVITAGTCDLWQSSVCLAHDASPVRSHVCVCGAAQMRECVEKIVEVVPEWLKIAKVGGVEYLVRRRRMQPWAIRQQLAEHFDALEADV